MFLFSLILLLLIAALLLPIVIRYVVQKQAHYFNFKWSNFNALSELIGIFDFTSEPMFHKLSFQIPSLRLQYKNRKIRVKISQCKIYLDLKTNRLCQVDGYRDEKVEKSKVLKNMQVILKHIAESFLEIDKTVSEKIEIRESQFQRSKKGIYNFIFMVICQIIELHIDKLTVTLIESRDQQPLEEFKQGKNASELNKMFKLYCTNRKYRLTLPEVTFTPFINKDEKLELQIRSKNFGADFKNEFTKKLDHCITIDQPSLILQMPFGFTLNDCINGTKIFISAKSITGQLTPQTCSAYKYLKYFRTFHNRLFKFIGNDLIHKEIKPTRSPMPKFIEIEVPVVSLSFQKLDTEIIQIDTHCDGRKCTSVQLDLTGVKVQVLTKLIDYLTVKETITCEFSQLAGVATVPCQDDIQLCNFIKGIFKSTKKYDVTTLKLLQTFDSFTQNEMKVHIHPIALQLYEAYININLRPYLEFDFDLYRTCLNKYIEECRKKILLSNSEPKNLANNFSASNNAVNNNNNNAINNSSVTSPSFSTPTGSQGLTAKDIKISDCLAVIDDKILLQTILNTENVCEEVSVPYLEMDYKSNFVEMYSFCGASKISLTSTDPRFYAVQKEENFEYQGVQRYTFSNLLLQKIPAGQQATIEKIFTMESFSQDVQESNDLVVQKFKFMLLQVCIKEESFKDFLDIKNKYNNKYFESLKQKKSVNPYQPPSFIEKPQKKFLDFRQFGFSYEFNQGQIISLKCDSLEKNSEGILKSLDEKISLKGIKLNIGMCDQQIYEIFEIKEVSHTVKSLKPNNLISPSQKGGLPSSSGGEYQSKFEYNLQFDTLNLHISEKMEFLSEYFSDLTQSVERVKEFSKQLNLQILQREASFKQTPEVQPDFISQMFKDSIKVSWKKLSLIIEDSKMNCFILGYQAFLRDYLTKQTSYNERHTLLQLQTSRRNNPLAGIYCDELVLTLEPLRTASSFENILKFINDAEGFSAPGISRSSFESFNCVFGSAGFEGASITMRDYPDKILNMDKGFIHLSVIFAQLKVANKSQSLRVFYNLLTEFGNFDFCVGLCQASGFNELLKRFNQLFSSKRSHQKGQNIKNSVSTAKPYHRSRSQTHNKLEVGDNDPHRASSTNKGSYLPNIVEEIHSHQYRSIQDDFPYWDRIRLCYHGKIVLSKDSIMNFKLLTHIYPYYSDCLQLSIGKSFLLVKEDSIKFYSQEILLKRKPRPETESHVVKIPLIQVECELNWNRQNNNHYVASSSEAALKQFVSKKLTIFSKFNLPRVDQNMANISSKQLDPATYASKRLKRIAKNSEVPFLHYQVDFVKWITSLPQLRRDQLFLYKIGIARNSNSADEPNLDDDTGSSSDEDINRQSHPAKPKLPHQKTKAHEPEPEEILGKNTDFFTLLTYSINSQLNSKSRKQNILKHVGEIKVRALMSSTRAIFSNTLEKLVSDTEEDDDPFAALDPIIGMQYVLDSAQFSFNINPKPTSTDSEKLSFKISNGYGKLDYTYGSVFKTKANLLNLDPPQFRSEEERCKSMYNPNVFAAYFGLSNIKLAEDMLIFNIQEELNGPFKQMTRQIDFRIDDLLQPKTEYSQSRREGSISNSQPTPSPIISEDPQDIPEFEFNISGIFFRSDSLVYEQNKSLGFEVSIQDENGVLRKEITAKQIIKNCLSFKGCKLLVTTQLNNIVNNIFFLDDGSGGQQFQDRSTQDQARSEQQMVEKLSKKIQFTESQSDGTIQSRLKFVLSIEDPQFNLFYKQEKNQMIFTSREKCFIMIQTHLLPYDKSKMDLKNNFKLFFKTLDCFAVRRPFSSQGVHWVNSYDDPTKKIFHIIRATHTVINFTTFNLQRCIIDFSKPLIVETNRERAVGSINKPVDSKAEPSFYRWNGQKRSRGLDLRVENLFSELEGRDYQCFYRTLGFFSLLIQSEQRQRVWAQQMRQKRNELRNSGSQQVFRHIERSMHMKAQDIKEQESHISYTIQTCIIKVLDPHRKPFLDFRLPSLFSQTLNFYNNAGSFQLIFGQITLKNLMEDGDFIDMIQYSGNDLQIRIENDFIDLKGIDPNTEWRAYSRYECFLPPLTVKLTENIYDPFYEFLFSEDPGDNPNSLLIPGNSVSQPASLRASSNSANTTPPRISPGASSQASDEFVPYSYFGKINIKDIKMCIHYKSQSSLKRLNGVSVIIQPYSKESLFITNKEFFDDFSSYLKKQVASQLFSLLSQKFFGYSKNLEDEQDDKKKKKKP